MSEQTINPKMKVFTTLKPEYTIPYVATYAQLCEAYGCEGILLFSDNNTPEPWTLAQVLLQHTNSLSPLIAVQPAYMHPFTVAKKIATLGRYYHRSLYLNMVAGGFKRDLVAIGDQTEHDARFDRLIEYTAIIKNSLNTPNPYSFSGNYYTLQDAVMNPKLPADLHPKIMISGSSEAAQKMVRQLGDLSIVYPEPERYKKPLFEECDNAIRLGLSIGIIARDSSELAWETAQQMFTFDRQGLLTSKIATKTSDAHWRQGLADVSGQYQTGESIYWLKPFQYYKGHHPYFVGSYDAVAEELANYITAGYDTVILNRLAEPEFPHVVKTINLAVKKYEDRVTTN